MMEKKYHFFYRVLAIASALSFFIVFFLMINEDILNPEWKRYQEEYSELIGSTHGQTEPPKNYTIRQIENKITGTTDRCITCHLNIGQTDFDSLKMPYASHPGSLLETHDLTAYSCTFCHYGNGRSLKRHQTCGMENRRDFKPVTSYCIRCHLAVYDFSRNHLSMPKITEGLEIVRSSGCLGCHRLRNLGGPFGPDLSNEGDKIYQGYSFRYIRGEKSIINWHREHFMNPPDVVPNSIMPDFNFNPEQIEALTTLVLGFSKPRLPIQYYTLGVIREIKGQRSRIDSLSAYTMICRACHGANGEGRDYKNNKFGVPSLANPDFQAVASLDMISFIINEGRSFRYMPAWRDKQSGIKEKELSDLVKFVRHWRRKATSYAQFVVSRYSINEGENIYKRYCATCHGETKKGGIGPSLDSNSLISLASDTFLFRTLSNGRANTAMPSWSRLEVGSLKSLIRYLKPHPDGRADRSLAIPSSADRERGKSIFHYECSRCHGTNGTGSIGPAILNRDFLNTADNYFIFETIRQGRAHTPMFGIKKSESDLFDLISFMRSWQDSITPFIESAPSLGNPDKGRELFLTYCSECHGKNGEGVAAPALNNQEFLNAATNGYLLATITIGRSSTPMPAWGIMDKKRRALSVRERQHVVSFIRSWQTLTIRRDASDPIYDLLAKGKR